MSLYFKNVKTIGKYKNVKKKIHIWKNVQVQLMSFCYINVEAIGKCRNVEKNPDKEFLLHTVEAKG